MTNCYENVRGRVSGYFSYITPKIFSYVFLFSLSDECSVVPDALNLFHKFSQHTACLRGLRIDSFLFSLFIKEC